MPRIFSRCYHTMWSVVHYFAGWQNELKNSTPPLQRRQGHWPNSTFFPHENAVASCHRCLPCPSRSWRWSRELAKWNSGIRHSCPPTEAVPCPRQPEIENSKTRTMQSSLSGFSISQAFGAIDRSQVQDPGPATLSPIATANILEVPSRWYQIWGLIPPSALPFRFFPKLFSGSTYSSSSLRAREAQLQNVEYVLADLPGSQRWPKPIFFLSGSSGKQQGWTSWDVIVCSHTLPSEAIGLARERAHRALALQVCSLHLRAMGTCEVSSCSEHQMGPSAFLQLSPNNCIDSFVSGKAAISLRVYQHQDTTCPPGICFRDQASDPCPCSKGCVSPASPGD